MGAIFTVGGAIGVIAGSATFPEGGPAAGIGALDVELGLFLISDANRRDDKAEAKADAEAKEKQAAEDKKAADKKEGDAKVPTVTPAQLPNAPTPTVTPEQLPDAPKEGDQYPDPHKGGQLPSGDGTVDPVDPRALPAEDGSVGPVDPRMLPEGDGTVGPLDPRMLPADENGHGGNPTTIWEENGGGVTPTTVGRGFYATRIGGRGLLVGIIQTGARSFKY